MKWDSVWAMDRFKESRKSRDMEKHEPMAGRKTEEKGGVEERNILVIVMILLATYAVMRAKFVCL